jgi:DNA-binding beta-propeller fold protein YncE
MARLLISEHQRNQVLALRGTGGTPLALPDGGLRKLAGLALQPDGVLIVADTGNHRLALYDVFGANWSYLGTGPGAGVLEFDRPTAVACASDGHVYVTDSGNGRIVRLSLDGAAWTAVGTRGRPIGPDGEGPLVFADPRSVAVLPTGDVVVADPGNARLVRLAAGAFDDPAGTPSWQIIGLPAEQQPARPFGVCSFAGGLAVTDVDNRSVHVLGDDGSVIAALTPAMQPMLATPAYVSAIDDATLAVADPSANAIRILRLAAGSLDEVSIIRGSDPSQPRHAFAKLGGLAT